MGKITTLRDLVGAIKDKASLSKAAIAQHAALRLAILRVTTHAPNAPPHDAHFSALLSLGDSSRATASSLVSALVDRLHRTGDSTVAIKCLLAAHHVIKRGSFILQDQLSVFPAGGGRNYLNLSAFRDGATAETRILSGWVRWYATYLESLLATSRILGYFLGSISSGAEKDKQDERISSFSNRDLIRDVDSLVASLERVCEVPDPRFVEGNALIYEVLSLLSNDYLSTVNELVSRLSEFRLRLGCLGFGESVELGCALRRLLDCRERLGLLFTIKKPSTDSLWAMATELRDRVAKLKVCKDERKLLTWSKGDPGAESARLEGRVMRGSKDSLVFSSGRLSMNGLPVWLESTNPFE